MDDWLIILIIAFGIIAIVMFTLYVISFKRHANDLDKKEESVDVNNIEENVNKNEIEENKNDEKEDNYESNDNNTNVEESSISSDSNTAVDEEKKEEAVSDKSEDEVKDESENPAETQSQEEKLKANNSDEFSMYDVPDREIEVIVILVNNDMCIFDANNHVLANGAYVRVFHNNYYEDGVVMKANTKVMLSTLEKVPEKLLLENDNLEGVFPVKEGDIETDNNKETIDDKEKTEIKVEKAEEPKEDDGGSLFELKDEIKNREQKNDDEEVKVEKENDKKLEEPKAEENNKANENESELKTTEEDSAKVETEEEKSTNDLGDDMFIPKKKKKVE